MKWPILWIAALAFVVSYGAILFGIYPIWHRKEQLTHKGLPTTAIVTDKHPMNHQSITYTYQVGRNSFVGLGPTGVGGVPSFDKIKIGDQINVRYLPLNPTISLPGDPTYLFHSWSGLLFILLPLICAGLSLAVGLWFRVAISTSPKRANR